MQDRGGKPGSELIGSTVVLAGLLLGLAWAKHHNYLLFHSLAELFSVVIGVSTFVVAWNSRRFHQDSFLLFLGMALLAVGALDLVHALAYKGMEIFPNQGSNLPTQLWVAARYVQAVSMLAAPLLIARYVRPILLGLGFAGTLGVLLASLFIWPLFPLCYTEGPGITEFKRNSEYVICVLLAGAAAGLLAKRGLLERRIVLLLVAANVLTIIQELCFTLYQQDVFGLWNYAGHCLKIVAFFLIYKAIVETGLARPYDLLFYELSRDIAARKQAEEAMAAARAEAERANAAKDAFIAALSHELRTPLTPVVAALSSVARDARLPADLREDVQMVQRNIGLEVALINDLLDVTRITRGKLSLNKQPVDAARILRDAAAICSTDLDAKGQTLAINTPGIPYPVQGDPARLHQVFWNLLKNAIKFTPAGGRISAECHTSAESCVPSAEQTSDSALSTQHAALSSGTQHPALPRVVIAIKDSGIGIAPDSLPRLFNAFEQGDRGHHFGGLGLGLAIAKGIVELHGGQISARSDGRDKGATFTVELPLIADASLPRQQKNADFNALNPDIPHAAERGRTLRILLVEDHPDTAKVMSRLLRIEGHNVVQATSVKAALAAVASDKFDVLMSDLGLPDGSGYDLMRRLVETGQKLPAVAVSGYGTAEDVKKSLEAGFVEHITKPVSFDALHRALIRISSSAIAKKDPSGPQ